MKSQAIADRDAFNASPRKKAQDQLDADNLEATRRHVGRRSHYSAEIRERLASLGYVGRYDSRHIEAFMRLEHSTLDGMDRRQFDAEVEIARQCIEVGGVTEAEILAQSYGL